MAAALCVVDSCGWLEYLANGTNAGFFEAPLLDTPRLLVPSLCIFEVCKYLIRFEGTDAAQTVLAFMRKARVVSLNEEQLLQAAQAAHDHKLSMADAIIWQTAQSHGAQLYTQDAGLQHMSGVSFVVKSPVDAQ